MAKRVRGLSVCALLVGEYREARFLLHEVFNAAGWRLLEARNRKRALHYLKRQPVHVVITDTDIAGWSWKNVLADLRRLERPPQLVVTSRTADDYLWSEVLNLGAYDVLSQPFHREEIERVISSARRRFDAEPFPPGRQHLTPAASVA